MNVIVSAAGIPIELNVSKVQFVWEIMLQFNNQNALLSWINSGPNHAGERAWVYSIIYASLAA